jgi:integrase
MSRELRSTPEELRDQRLLAAFAAGRASIAEDLVFPGEGCNPVSVRNLSENYFLPALERANLRRFRFHDLRHTFGSLLIEAEAPLCSRSDGTQFHPDHCGQVRSPVVGTQCALHRSIRRLERCATKRNPDATGESGQRENWRRE